MDACLAEMRSIMVARQRKYGKRNVREQGLYGILTRGAADKVARVMQALHGRVVAGRVELEPIADAADETFEDGLTDTANYFGVIAKMVKRGWWELPYGDELGDMPE